MPLLTIHRPKQFTNARREYRILIDGKVAGTVTDGKSVGFDLPVGTHKVVAQIDRRQSPEESITLEAGQDRVLYVSMHKGANWAIPFLTVLVALHFALRLTTGFTYTILLAIPLMLYIIYTLTIGRKKYLRLEEETAGAVL
jgi:hypothetical protein